MKKLIHGFVCLLLILSCEIEGIPKSITIKGKPGLYVPLGSPFAGLEEGERLEDLISPSKIIEMMGSSADGLAVYEVNPAMAAEAGIDPKVQAYLVHYPLADMPLNMENYIDGAMNDVNAGGNITIPSIPGVTGPFPSGTYYYIYGDGSTPGLVENPIKPFLKIPLNDMAKLVKQVTRKTPGKFGLEINYTPELADHLELKIPAFGIDTYKKGEPYPSVNPAKLLYYNSAKTMFNPRIDLQPSGDNHELWVYARISGPCSGNLELKMLFDWETAVINTQDNGDFKSEYPIENSLGNFLGGGASFKKVDGYVYMSGLNSTNPVVMTVDIGNGTPYIRNLTDADPSFNYTVKPDGTKVVSGSLTASSFTSPDTSPLNLAPIFKGDGATLKVDIKIQEITITNSDDFGDKRIKFNLFVLIPMDLEVKEVSGKEAPDVIVNGVNLRTAYVPLDFGDMLANTGDDLFGRKDGEDNLLDEVEFVEITIKGINITIIDKECLAVLVKNNNDYRMLEFRENASLKFDKEFLRIPFSPEFNVLLKKDIPGTSSGSFTILRSDNPKFDFRLELNAKANIEQTITF
jgi:hypothetical protein